MVRDLMKMLVCCSQNTSVEIRLSFDGVCSPVRPSLRKLAETRSGVIVVECYRVSTPMRIKTLWFVLVNYDVIFDSLHSLGYILVLLNMSCWYINKNLYAFL